MTETHFVEVPCQCPDAEHCSMERYISDIRILVAGIDQRLKAVEQATAVLRSWVTT